MKRFFKVFMITFVVMLLGLGCFIYGYVKVVNPVDKVISDVNSSFKDSITNNGENGDGNLNNDEDITPLQQAIMSSKRINILLVGFEHVRTDVIILVSFDRETKHCDFISVPRDTYYERKKYDDAGKQKINAVWQDEDISGLIDAVKSIINVPIHRYVTVDYAAVKKCVDILDGVEVEIPFRMYYHDYYDSPPLSIEFEPGTKLLNGDDALRFLRFRKNDDGSHSIGDLGRIQMQQMFIKSAIKKAVSYKLASIIEEMYSHIDTNFSFSEILDLSGDLVEFSTDNMEAQLMPNILTSKNGTSYVLPDDEKIVEMVYKLYGVHE